MSFLFGEQPSESAILEEKAKKKTTKEPKVKLIEDKQEASKELREIKQIHSFDAIGKRILQQFHNDKLHHATMLSGSFGIGKATFAYWLICQMILSRAPNEEMKQISSLDMGYQGTAIKHFDPDFVRMCTGRKIHD